MAKNSAIFQKISPGMDSELATDGLISMMKAYEVGYDEVLDGIISKVNIVGNEFATENSEIVEAMMRSSSAMAAANNTLEQTIALNSASVEITRNAETTANAWKTVSMRLRGYDEETEELSNDLKTITGDIADLTKVASNNYQGISLFTDEDKETYKSTYEIISDISKIWDELSDKSQAQLLEKIAGKRNAQVVAAAIKNFETAEKSMDAMANSAGGALKEMGVVQEEIASHINTFKATFVQLGQEIFKQEDIRTVVDLGTKLLELLKDIITEGTELNTILQFSGIGNPLKEFAPILDIVKELKDSFIGDGISGFISALGTVAEKFSKILKPLQLSTIVGDFTNDIKKAKEENEKFLKSFDEYEDNSKKINEEIDSLEDLITDYQKLISSTDDLTTVKSELADLQNNLIDKYGNEANSIDLVNKSLEENIRLYREKITQENKDYLTQNKKKFEEAQKVVLSTTQDVLPSKTDINKYWSQKTIDNWVANGIKIDWDKSTYQQTNPYNVFSDFGWTEIAIKTDKQGVEANKEIISQLRLMAELYSEQDGFQQEKLNLLYEEIKVRESAQVLYEDYISRQNNVDAYNEVSEATWNKLDELKSKYTELQNKVATTDSLVVMQNASTELLEVENELKSLQSVNSLVSDEVEHLFSVYENGARQVRTSTDVMEGALEAHKENFEMIEKYNNALDTLADGKSISIEDMWTFVDNDLNGDLRFLQETQEGMKVSMDEFVKSKDEYIRSIMESTRARIQENKTEVNCLLREIELLEAKTLVKKGASVNSPADVQAWTKRNQQVNALNSKLKELEKSIKEDEYALSLYNNELGYSLELTQKIADNYLNAFTDQIDKITDSLESQKETLEDELETLEEQLDVLEKQKETLEETIDNYETIAEHISEIVRDEADALKEQQEELENSYDEHITSIEDFYDSEIEKLQEANKERERNIELEEKLLALENAKKKRVKVYNETSGSFEYRGDQDAAMTARKDVQETRANFELEDKISKLEKTRDELVKQIEDEKASVTDSFESQIEALEEYAEKWEEISKEVTDAEKDMLAEQIFGSEWREKIKNKDTTILTKFKTSYKNYNTELKNLVSGEIASLEKSIEAKEKDIETKQKEIDSWNDYKDKVQQAAKDIENSLNGYADMLNDIKLDESSNFAEREAALKTFTEKYVGYLQQIKSMQDQISGVNMGSITLDTGSIKYSAEFLEVYLEAILSMRKALEQTATGYGLVNSAHDAKIAQAAIDKDIAGVIESLKKLKGYSLGGTNDRTGLAMLHGTKSSAETIFNATDSKKLYDLVHNTDNISAMLANNIMRNLNNNSNIKSISSTPTTVTNHWSFGDIVANSPVEFAKQMENYWRQKATESLVR